MDSAVATETQELHAFVDGQLSPEARRRVQERLASDPDARRQVVEYRAIRRDLSNLYDPVLLEAVPKRLLRRRRRWLGSITTMVASLFLLHVGTWFGLNDKNHEHPPLAAKSPHVVRAGAMAYAVYTPEMRHPGEVPGEQEQHLVAWLTQRMEAAVSAPKLDRSGFPLPGGRLGSSEI